MLSTTLKEVGGEGRLPKTFSELPLGHRQTGICNLGEFLRAFDPAGWFKKRGDRPNVCAEA